MENNSPQNQSNPTPNNDTKLDPSALSFRSLASDIAKLSGKPIESFKPASQTPKPEAPAEKTAPSQTAAATNTTPKTPNEPFMGSNRISTFPNTPLGNTIPIRQEIDQVEKMLGHKLPEGQNPFNIAGKPDIEVAAAGKSQKAFEAANAPVTEKTPKEDPKKVVEALHKETPLQTRRTIQTDLEDAAQKKKTTVENIIINEQVKAQAQKKTIEDPKRSLYILFLSGLLIVVGFLALAVVYVIQTAPKAPEPVIVDSGSIIVTENSQVIPLVKGQSIQEAINAARNIASSNNKTITKLVFKEGTSTEAIGGVRFAGLLSSGTAGMPAWLIRTFKPEYLAGLYDSSNGWKPVFIFKLTSYESSYAGMLQWEKTMKDSLAPFLTIITPKTQLETTVSTTTSSTSSPQAASTKTKTKATTTASTTKVEFTNPVIQTGFRDVIIKNKDTRVLEDSSGRRLLFYSFPDKQTLVITTDQAALEEVFARLTTSKFVR